MEDKISVRAVGAFPTELHIIERGVGEYIFYEGGCQLTPGIESFGNPYSDLAKTASVSSKLLSDLRKNMALMQQEYENNPYSKEGENAERKVLLLERKLAKTLQRQGVDLRKYFESYKGTKIN